MTERAEGSKEKKKPRVWRKQLTKVASVWVPWLSNNRYLATDLDVVLQSTHCNDPAGKDERNQAPEDAAMARSFWCARTVSWVHKQQHCEDAVEVNASNTVFTTVGCSYARTSRCLNYKA
jgi:hypothetical protein